MARSRKRQAAKNRVKDERRGFCETQRRIKMDSQAIFAEYMRLADSGGVCPVCGYPLVDPDALMSCSVFSPKGIVHESCA